MKRTIAILLAVMLLAAIMPTASFAEAVSNSSGAKTAVYRTVAVHGLYLRTGAGTKYKLVQKTPLPNGTAITVSKTSGNWCKVKVLKTGKKGWVSKKYIAKKAYAKVTTKHQGLNVHTVAGNNQKTVKYSLPKGAKNVQVKYIIGNWAYVKYGKLEGWVSRTYLAWMV